MLETKRLFIRKWRSNDSAAFADLNADRDVMTYFPSTLNSAESDALLTRFTDMIERNNGWGFWAVEIKATGEFAGFAGLANQPDRFTFSPCTEIGWRLNKKFWGQGIAKEAAEASLRFAFNILNVEEVVSFTSIHNKPSENLMKRLGMRKHSHFPHPAFPDEHYLSEHVLYTLKKEHFSL